LYDLERRRLRNGDRDGGVEAPAAEDAAAFALGRTPPHSVVDAVSERVLETVGLHRALTADLAGPVDPHTVGGEELGRRQRAAARPEHPLLFAVVGRGGHFIHLHPSARVDPAPIPTTGPSVGFPGVA